MTCDEVHSHIETTVNRQITQKGLTPVKLEPSACFLGGDIPIDSLDLAVIVTELERATKKESVQGRFQEFSHCG